MIQLGLFGTFLTLSVAANLALASTGESLNWIVSAANTLPVKHIDKNSDEKMAGIAVDLENEIAQRLGRKSFILTVPRLRVENFLLEGKADGYCYARPIWFTHPASDYYFTKPLFVRPAIILSRQAMTLQEVRKLRGQSIGTVRGYLYAFNEPLFVNGHNSRKDVGTVEANLESFVRGRINYAIADDFSWSYYKKIHHLSAEKYFSTVILQEPLQCVFSKKSQIEMKSVNDVITAMIHEGVVEKILKKYE